jgi:serine/threonine-protein kinase
MPSEKIAPIPPLPALPAGTLIGKKFELMRLIGEGGMGRVYLAKDQTMGREVAIKTLLPEAKRPDFIARFQGEARKLSTVDGHANIVRVHEWGEDETVGPYLVMEYLSGQNLRSVVRAEGPLELVRALEILLAVCSAVRTCHKMGVIHRDLKAGNVMVTSDAEGHPLVKVLDFGVAKAISAAASAGVEITNPGWLVGTPEYMAPEQVNQEPVTEATDQYAIGVLLYFCLTRRLPFKSDRPGQMTLPLARAIAEGKFAGPRTLQKGIPQEVEDIIAKAMARRPEERFATVRDLGAAIASLPCMKGRRGHAAWVEYFSPGATRLDADPPPALDAAAAGPAPRSTMRDVSQTIDPPGGTIGGSVERQLRELSGKITSVEDGQDGQVGRRGNGRRRRPIVILGGLGAAAMLLLAIATRYGTWAGAGQASERESAAARAAPVEHEVPANVPALVPPLGKGEELLDDQTAAGGPRAAQAKAGEERYSRQMVDGDVAGSNGGRDRAAPAQGEDSPVPGGEKAGLVAASSSPRAPKKGRRLAKVKPAVLQPPAPPAEGKASSGEDAPFPNW